MIELVPHLKKSPTHEESGGKNFLREQSKIKSVCIECQEEFYKFILFLFNLLIFVNEEKSEI